MKILTVVVFVSFRAFAAAQESSRIPVPVWPGNQAEAAQRYKGQSVFVNPEGTKLIVLLGGEQSEIACIPSHKQIRPVVNVSISDNSGDYIYQYTVANEAAAKDPIGTWCIVIPKEPFERPIQESAMTPGQEHRRLPRSQTRASWVRSFP